MRSYVNDGLNYNEALKILGGQKNRLVLFLDAVASVGLTAWAGGTTFSGGDAGIPLGLYEIKNDIASYAQGVMRRVSEWRSGLSRFDRTERLVAAHSVIVISSFFEAIDLSGLPVNWKQLKITSAEQAALATAQHGPPDGYAGMIHMLLQEPLPMPEPHRTYEATRGQIETLYRRLGWQLLKFIENLTAADLLNQADHLLLQERITNGIATALSLYDNSYRNLAVDNQEFMVWASLTEAHAVGAGLERITDLLKATSVSRSTIRSREHLISDYRSALTRRLVASGQEPEDVVLPLLGAAYINPCCQIAEIGPEDTPAANQWWDEQESVPDIERFLTGYLLSLRATQAPLVVLGEPGSGKSTLTEVLAARLCDSNFLPVRVELRGVAAESTIFGQIEQAILNSSGDHVDWHDLVESAEEALPVVLLDGFDELLQAAGTNRYDYLEQVQDFQSRQARNNHPVAVIVTSRTVVADRARFPRGSLGLRLQPFTEDQVQRWLEMWNRYNADSLRARGLTPLTSETVLRHRELAEQPLLLLMLAIFDATTNALQQGDTLSRGAELYRVLIMDFALREVRKSAHVQAGSDAAQHGLAEREVLRLAIVALAMFVRGSNFVSATELNRDLPVLFSEEDSDDNTPADRVVGRFFFIHRSEARSSGKQAHSYEFLHATFEEFLVAWLTVRALQDLVNAGPYESASTAYAGRPNDGFLYAALSFRCLAARGAVVGFLDELLAALPDRERTHCQSLIPELLADALYPHPDRSRQDYEPVRKPFPERAASYTANLVILFVLMADRPIRVNELFGYDHPVESWYKHAHLWKGMFSPEEWSGLLDAVRAEKPRREILLARELGMPVSFISYLSYPSMPGGGTHPEEYDFQAPSTSVAGIALRELAFLSNWSVEHFLLELVPFMPISNGWLLEGRDARSWRPPKS